MNIPLLLSNNCREENRNGTKNLEPSAIDSTTHDVINQLSVISLCCCELGNSMAEKLEADQLNEFKRIELAIQAVAKTIQKFRAIARDHGYPPDNGKSQSA